MKTFFPIITFLFVLAIYSCGDNCGKIDCGPGYCEGDTCICPVGLEGAACEITSNSVFYGNYEVVDATCGTSSNTTNIKSLSIAAHSNGEPTEVEITASSTTDTGTINGVIINGGIDAEGSFSFFTLEISGKFSNIDNFEATLTGAGFVCRDVTYAR